MVPSVRFSRDKRGYEYVYLVHTSTRRGKPGRTRVLYWYRTPPGVRIGRRPFDEEVRRTVEQQNPGVAFDWEAIIATPMPPPDMTEFWRERRRAEKAARQERRASEAAESGEEPEDEHESSGGADAADGLDLSVAPAEEAAAARLLLDRAEPASRPDADRAEPSVPSDADPARSPRKRRRRGRRRAPGAEGRAEPVAGDAEPSEPAAGASERVIADGVEGE